MAEYLLPCSCGKKIVVDARTAGQMMRCECGASVEAPTFRGLAALERADKAAAIPSRREWTTTKGFAFLFVVVAVAALVGVSILYNKLQVYDVSSMLPGPAHRTWTQIDDFAKGRMSLEELHDIQMTAALNRWVIILSLIAGGAVVGAIATVAIDRSRAARQAPRRAVVASSPRKTT